MAVTGFEPTLAQANKLMGEHYTNWTTTSPKGHEKELLEVNNMPCIGEYKLVIRASIARNDTTKMMDIPWIYKWAVRHSNLWLCILEGGTSPVVKLLTYTFKPVSHNIYQVLNICQKYAQKQSQL